jgi:putative FmdB family regulatory protein
MPTYDYLCADCGYRFEMFQKMTDELVKICPQCQHTSVRRLIGGGNGLLFKGSGFYITDYKRSGNANSGTSEKKTETTKSEKTTTKV